MSTATKRGTTLVELLTAIIILSAVLGLFLRALHQQQRFYISAAMVLEERGQLRHATSIVPASIRGLSAPGGDFLALSDSAIELRAHLGAAILCDTLAGRGVFDVAPERTAAGVTLAAYVDRPRPGDEVFVLDDGPTTAALDDRWLPLGVASVMPVTGACATSPLLDPVRDAATPRLRIALAPGQSLGTTVLPGAPVRFTRRARLRLYRSGRAWFLGYADWNGGGFNTVQPVSGPYRPYAAPGGASGLAFRFFDSTGVELRAPLPGTPITRVTIIARATTAVRIRRSDLVPGGDDSLAVSVVPRNRR